MEPGAAEGRALGRSRVFCWGCPRAGGPSHKGSGPPLHPRGGCEKPAASAPALSWHHGRGRIRGSLPRPPSSQGPTSQAPQPPSASWGGQGLFLPCSPSPQLGCSWCRGVRILSVFLLPPLSSLPRRHALPSPMEGCLWRGCALFSSGHPAASHPFLHEATHTIR